jgi:glycine betaine/proline transport system ATP-binding protein
VLRPATLYVAEFVRHMNPLNVMTGASVMRHAASLMVADGGVLLDAEGHYRLDETGLGLTCKGERHEIARIEDPDAHGAFPDGVIACPSSVSVRTLIRMCAESHHPVLLMEGGAVVGVCMGQDILRALGGGGGQAVV